MFSKVQGLEHALKRSISSSVFSICGALWNRSGNRPEWQNQPPGISFAQLVIVVGEHVNFVTAIVSGSIVHSAGRSRRALVSWIKRSVVLALKMLVVVGTYPIGKVWFVNKCDLPG